jgi:hypothetical protein
MIATIKDNVLTLQPETREERNNLAQWGINFSQKKDGTELEFLFPPIFKISDDGMYIIDNDTGNKARWRFENECD